MNLRDLVGRMAIRTDKVREVMPWEMERAFRLDFMVPVPIFDREKYMDEPVRILVGERGDGAGYISHFASCKKYRR